MVEDVLENVPEQVHFGSRRDADPPPSEPLEGCSRDVLSDIEHGLGFEALRIPD